MFHAIFIFVEKIYEVCVVIKEGTFLYYWTSAYENFLAVVFVENVW